MESFKKKELKSNCLFLVVLVTKINTERAGHVISDMPTQSDEKETVMGSSIGHCVAA